VQGIDLLREPPEWIASRLTLYRDGEKVAVSDRGEVSYAFRTEGTRTGVYHVGANAHVQTEGSRRDFGFMSSSRSWRVTVLPYGRPAINVPSQVTITPNGSVDLPVEVSHSDAAEFSLSMAHAPEGAVLENGHFRWKPEGRTGAWKVDFHARNADGHGVTESSEIRVASEGAGDTAIDIQPSDPIATITGKAISTDLKAVAADAGHLLFECVQVPEGVEVPRETGAVSWVPSVGQAGPHRLRFRVKNGSVAREVDVKVWVSREAKPTPVSYSSSYKPRTVADLEDLKRSPLAYHQLFETLRLMRDRYAVIHRQAFADMQVLFPNLSPALRQNCLEELDVRAWEFANRPAVLRWMRAITATENSLASRQLVEKLDAIDRSNARRLEEAEAEDQQRAVKSAEAPAG
jgi:hypothetical protein